MWRRYRSDELTRTRRQNATIITHTLSAVPTYGISDVERTLPSVVPALLPTAIMPCGKQWWRRDHDLLLLSAGMQYGWSVHGADEARKTILMHVYHTRRYRDAPRFSFPYPDAAPDGVPRACPHGEEMDEIAAAAAVRDATSDFPKRTALASRMRALGAQFDLFPVGVAEHNRFAEARERRLAASRAPTKPPPPPRPVTVQPQQQQALARVPQLQSPATPATWPAGLSYYIWLALCDVGCPSVVDGKQAYTCTWDRFFQRVKCDATRRKDVTVFVTTLLHALNLRRAELDMKPAPKTAMLKRALHAQLMDVNKHSFTGRDAANRAVAMAQKAGRRSVNTIFTRIDVLERVRFLVRRIVSWPYCELWGPEVTLGVCRSATQAVLRRS